MRRFTAVSIVWAAVAACVSLPCGSPADPQDPPTLPVGWHDELKDHDQWTPHPRGQEPRLFRPKLGSLGLRVRAPREDAGKAPFYWASVYRAAEVDLDQYPILAVRAVEVSKGAWWDVMAQELRDGKPVGPELKTPSLREPGLLTLDLTRNGGLTGRKQVRIRLNVAHEKGDGRVSYAWVRFIQRSDLEAVRRNPDLFRVFPSP